MELIKCIISGKNTVQKTKRKVDLFLVIYIYYTQGQQKGKK